MAIKKGDALAFPFFMASIAKILFKLSGLAHLFDLNHFERDVDDGIIVFARF